MLVDPETGEIVERHLDADQARALTDQLKIAVSDTWDLVEQAFKGRAWVALDYGSWDEYCNEEFPHARLRLPAEDRREVVASMRDAGMSTRATAAALGINDRTVRRDLEAGAANAAPQVSQFGTPDPIATGPVEREADTPAPPPAPPVTGLDGKTYQPPAPKPPPPSVTPEEQRTIDLHEANDRDAKRLTLIVAHWDLLENLTEHSRRDQILALMHPEDRVALSEIEELIHA